MSGGSVPLGFAAALIAGGESTRMGRDKRLIEVGGQPLWQRQIEVLRSLKPMELVISGPEDGPWNRTIGAPSAVSARFISSHQRAETALGAPVHGELRPPTMDGHRGHEPTPDPSQEGNCSGALHSVAPLLGGVGGGSVHGKEENYRVIPDQLPDCGPLAGIAAVLAAVQSPLVLMLAVDMPQMSAAFLQSLLNKCTGTCGVVLVRGDMFEPLAAVYPRSCAALAENQLRSGNYSLQQFVKSCLDARLLVEFQVTSADEGLFHNFNRPEDLPAGSQSVRGL